MYKRAQSIDLTNKTIVFSSPGGEVKYAALLAEQILDSEISLKVRSFCISACAEFVLPAAKNIKFENHPIIGFHWGPLMDYGQYKIRYDDIDDCHFSALSTQRKIFKNKNLNIEFWKETELRLKLTKFKLINKGLDCPWKDRHFQNDLWLPTSRQLRELLGLNFSGSVCADNFKICSKRIDQTWKKGKRIVIGNEIYVSKGNV